MPRVWLLCILYNLLLCIVSSQANVDVSCSTGWTAYGRICYKAYSRRLSWGNSLDICSQDGAQLAIVEDHFINDFISSLAESELTNEYWIGLSRPQVANASVAAAQWSDGTEWSIYQGFWANGQPNTLLGHCVFVAKSSSLSEWSLGSCEHKRGFVCQYSGCDADNFRCFSGECVASSRACDGQMDCADGSDEIDCPNIPCINYIKETSGEISLLGIPNPVEANKECKWTIEGPIGSVIVLQFAEFKIGDGYDIIVLGGSKTEQSSWTLLRLTDVKNGNGSFKISSPNNLMIFRFISDGNRRLNNFRVTWTAVRYSSPDEGIFLEAKPFLQSLTQEFYPDFYLSNQEKVYIIKSDAARDIVHLQVAELDITEGDYIIVRDGNSVSSPLLGEYRATSPIKRNIFSTGPEMYILFKTNKQELNEKRGYLFYYKTGCDVDIEASYGEVATPGYPYLNYAPFQTCLWTIKSPLGNSITLHFDASDFGIHPTDSLQVNEIENSKISLLLIHSGLQAPQDVHVESGKASLSFTSSALDNSQGFTAQFSIGCPDPLFNPDTLVTPPVAFYPYRIKLNVSCPVGFVFSSEEFYDENAAPKSMSYVEMECLLGGSWNVVNSPQCIGKYCGLPPSINEGYIVSSNGTQYQSVANYACLRGYQLSGNPNVACDETGTWEQPPTCNVLRCPSLNTFNTVATPTIKHKDGTASGSVISFSCPAGYKIEGSPVLYCQDDGTWDYPLPACKPLLCVVPEIQNGMVGGNLSVASVSDSLIVECNEGYIIRGTQSTKAVIICLSDQTFGTLPQCEVSGFDYCTANNCSTNETCFNEIGGFKCICKDGYELQDGICLDIDECLDNPDICGQICENMEGSYQCACELGYSLYIFNGTNNFFIAPGETGLIQGDVFQINHTCVLNLCVDPGVIQNGYISNPRSDYYVGYELTIGCDLGFVPNDGVESYNCDNSSSWSPSIPSCEVATCPPDVLPWLINGPKSIIANDPISYGDEVILNCEVIGKPIFNKTRSCIYNPSKLKYELQGDDYECGVIDCGPPENFLPEGAVAVFLNGLSTTVGGSFLFDCRFPYFRSGGSIWDPITCQANGQWKFDDLECIYGVCPYPGQPLNGQVIIEGYNFNDNASFTCDQSGFEPYSDKILNCVNGEITNGLIWDDVAPVCVDVESPTFIGCSVGVKLVHRYDSADIVVPIGQDNSGSIKEIQVSPQYFRADQPIAEDLTITYTAYDHTGLNGSCSIAVNVLDDIAPSIQCPPPVIVYIIGTESITYTFNDSSFIIATDDTGIASKTLSVSNMTVGVQDIGKAFDIKATAFDSSGNNASCLFQLYVSDEKCSERGIKTPLNSNKTCSVTNTGGFTCEFTCLAGFYFYDIYPNDKFVSTCEPGQDFEPQYIPSCTDTAPISSAVRVYLSYGAESGAEIFDNCTELIRAEVESFISGIRPGLSTLCVTQPDIDTVQLKDTSVTANYIDFKKQTAIAFRLEMLPFGADESQYINCSSAVESEIAKLLQDDGLFKPVKNITIDFCPVVSIVFQNANEIFECENSKSRTRDGITICLKCPPGTSLISDGTCEPCPVGSYWVESANSFPLNQCEFCPPGLSTASVGSTGSEYCTASCVGNFVSPSGVSPCEECGNNTYRYNSTHCKACPDKTKALRRENPLSENCTVICTYRKIPSIEVLSEKRATYSASVDDCKSYCDRWQLLNPGSQCVGFNYSPNDNECFVYDSLGKRAIETELDFYERECGNEDFEDCYCAAQCQFGFYSDDGFEPNCKPCPAGFTSSPGSIFCSECASNETSVPGTGVCFDAAKSLCLLGTCLNGGVCRVENHDFYCECQIGYSGRQCESEIDSCASSPCYYGGNCTNISGGQFECQCPSGTNGSRCENNINDCQTDTCNGRGSCIDGFDSFTCLCVDSFEGDQCQIRKILPCNRLACEPNGTLSCNPINDVYGVCTCNPGYEGPTCAIDIDSCASSPCINGGTCIDGIDDFSCSCLPGFKGDKCEIEDYTCSDAKCGNSVSCEEDYRTGNPMCVCQEGYYQGIDCSYNFQNGYIEGELILENNLTVTVCQLLCNLRDDKCIAISFQFLPDELNDDRGICKSYSRVDKIVTDVPTDVIASEKSCQYYSDDTYTSSWVNTNYFENGFNVALTDVYTEFRDMVCKGTQPVNAKCRIADSVQPVPQSVSCGTSGVKCTPQGNFTCLDVEIQFECARSRVFLSESDACIRKDICDELKPCVRGLCVNDETSNELYRCQCPPGYEGFHCQHEINECLTANGNLECKNNATCVDIFLGFSCQCQAGFTGGRCEDDIDECLTADCSNAGTQKCIDVINGYECSCKTGFTGEKCLVDIDDCLSQPCYHGGSCVDLTNGYGCSCAPGWTGLQCDTMIDQCVPSPCQNGATCFDIFMNNHCECFSNYFGELCEDAEDICKNANPCYNGGSCTSNGQSCICPSGNKNLGCYLNDFSGCSDITCENGGSCFSNITTPAKCICPEEFMGSGCESHVNNCDFVNCFSEATCIDGVDEAFCRCPVGKFGPVCSQDIDDNFDACFRASSTPTGMSLSFPAPYTDTGGFTLKYWIKFSSPGSSGEILTMSYSSSGYLDDNPIPILTLNDAGLVLGNYATIPFRYKPVNDGNWHYVIVTWEKSTGHVDLILDFVRSGQIDGYAQGAALTGGGFEIVIGAKKNAQFQENFVFFLGCISKLEVLSRAIDFNDETEFTTLSALPGDIVRWGEFAPYGNADIAIPSSATITDCGGNGIGPSCVPARDLIPPKVVSCQDDIIISTIYERAQAIWTEPSFDGAVSISSSHQPGTYFGLGAHTVLYAAKDMENNTAFCDFKVFVNSDNCSSLEPPRGGGSQKCYDSSLILDPFSSCTIECPGSDLTLVDNTPVVFSCGAGGKWNSLTISDDLYPACGKIVSEALKNITVLLKYNITFTDCSSITAALNNREILDDLTKFRQIWGNSVCSENDCGDVPISVNCDNLPNTFVQFNISNVNSLLTSNQGSYSAEEALASEIYDNGLFDVSDVFVSSIIDKKQFEMYVTLFCEGNQVLREEQCVECGPGTFYNTDKMECVNCPIGTYQNQFGQMQCLDCLGGKTTERVGSVEASLCKASCQAGEYFSLQTNVCSPCDIGFYQDVPGQFECKPCDVGQVTGQEGSVSNASCSDGCISGEQLLPSGVCAPCPIGTYREFGLNGICNPCPDGYTTPAIGSINQVNCSILKCPPGSRANDQNKACQLCGKGQYQSEINQQQCASCPGNYTTENEGEVFNSSCVRYCPSGQEFDGTNCVECGIAFYKTNTVGLLGECQPCAIGYLTEQTGSTSSADCNIRNCTAGFKIVTVLGSEICEACPLGKYQPAPYQYSCIECPGKTYTQEIGAINLSECEDYCDPGYDFSFNNTCQPCPQGYYKSNNFNRFSLCQICPDDNFITDSTASTSVNDCTIANCSAGSFRSVTNQCELCPIGFYQAQKWQTGCSSCPDDYTTSSKGSKSDQDCLLNCPLGTEDINGTCVDCPIGYYKDLAGSVPCTQCTDGFITSQVGTSKLTDCNIRACSPGNYRNVITNQCSPCPYGQYQPQRWKDSCISCQDGFTTFTSGAQSEKECFTDCPVGTTYRSIDSTCQQCPRGTYRDKSDPSQISCVLCPLEFITPDVGSLNVSECTIRNCSLGGEFRNPENNLCEVCGRGTYNNVKWRESCTSCPPGFTTKELGRRTQDECFRECPSGQAVNENTNECEDCGLGFFRNKAQSWSCQQCPQSLSTQVTQAVSESQCTVSSCLEGQLYNATSLQCEACPLDTYQPQPNQLTCLDCPGFWLTLQTGANAISDCISKCAAGFHNCSQDATCLNTDDGNVICACNENYFGSGENCTHVCDGNEPYCKNGGTCSKSTSSPCTCPQPYTGRTCQAFIFADLSKDDDKPVIIGSSIGGVIFLLLLLLLLIFLIKRLRQKSSLKGEKTSEEDSSYSASLSNQPTSRFITRANTLGHPSFYHDYSNVSADPSVYIPKRGGPEANVGQTTFFYDNNSYVSTG